MVKKVVDQPDLIKLYMEIAAFSEKPCVFFPDRSESSFEAEIVPKPNGAFSLTFNRTIPGNTGILLLRVFTLQFKTQVDLHRTPQPKVYELHPPNYMDSHDPRRFLRIPLAPQITKIVVLKKLDQSGKLVQDRSGKLQASLLDISANGLAFHVAEPDEHFKPGGRLTFVYNLFGITVQGIATVVAREDLKIRCKITDMDRALQTRLDRKIHEGFDKLLVRHHQELKNLFESGKKLRSMQAQKQSSGELRGRRNLDPEFIELINPVLESAVSVLESFVGISLTKKEVRLERICSGIYDISTQISFKGPKVQGNLFLCMKQEPVLKIGERVLGFTPEKIDDDVKDMIGEVCNIIIGNSKKNLKGDKLFKLSTPTIIQGKEHVVAVLSKYPVIRMVFETDIGPVDLNLFVDEIYKKLGEATSGAPPEFEYNEALIQPILSATENIFQNYLGLNTRKKGVNLREKLMPRFELSAILDVYTDQMRGKILLNVSNKLAFQIHKTLLAEEKDTVDESVKDALGEMVNIITGNAKADFSKMNLVYQLSTPYVIYGRNQIISNAGNDPFISSIYNTDAGFFEICLSFMRAPQ
jgi:chemotaxis protein CheX